MAENNITSNDILYLDTKAIFVQLYRSLPKGTDQKLTLTQIAEKSATTKDATLVRKGIKVKEMLRELEETGIIDRRDGYKLMQEEVDSELLHLGNIREKINVEARSLESVYTTICDHNNYLRSQLDTYKAYLSNVRMTSSSGSKDKNVFVGVLAVGGKEKKVAKSTMQGPYRFTHAQLEKELIIRESNVPEARRPSIYFMVIQILFLQYRAKISHR